MDSRISGFYKLPLGERLKVLKNMGVLSDLDLRTLEEGLSVDQAEKMIENVAGLFQLPLGVATNYQVNGRDYLVPMVTEEASVVAASSNAAKIARAGGGFKAVCSDPIMVGQIQLTGLTSISRAKKTLLDSKEELIEHANNQDPVLVRHGGGVRDIEVREVDTLRGTMLVLHLLVDVRDAMGANAVNTMAESIAPKVEEKTKGKVYLRIISNYAVKRTAKSKAVFPKDALGGEAVVEGILNAWALSQADVYRAVTHNKGVMNGVSAVVCATGNDTRAVEAGCHSFASRSGEYKPLTAYYQNDEGDLVGEIEIPCPVGLVGGATRSHPIARLAVKILGVKSANQLGEVIASVGLAQNLAALKALGSEGIQRGHMSLHAKNIAIQAGAEGALIDQVAKIMVLDKKVREDYAREILARLKRD
ncbi:MAG: hydroxymethylglutaryl-CoA reductase, degradative [Candidatus Altiarchaeales archaeon]|nr:hydroxymethylglutaryl-CoA reductase, degradative [Candidatus Altiarchaeales archaeon]